MAIVSIGLFVLRPRVLTAVLLRLVMAAVVAGAALGMYQHVAGNAAFEREIHVEASIGAERRARRMLRSRSTWD